MHGRPGDPRAACGVRQGEPAPWLTQMPHSPATAPHAPARRSPLALVAVALAGLLVACGTDGVGPVPLDLDATYVLESVNGVAIPATAAEGGGQRYVLLADTLRFSRDGTVARSFAFRHVSETVSPRDTVYESRMTFDYRTTPSGVAIGFFTPCPPNANCVGFEEGVLTPDGVIVRARLFWSGEPVLRFRRVPNA